MAYVLHSHGVVETIAAVLVPGYLLIAAFWLTAPNPTHYGTSLGTLLTPPANAPGTLPAAVRDFLGAIRQSLPSFFRELLFALAICALVFPFYVVGWYYWIRPTTPFAFHLRPELIDFAATQVL